MDVTALEEQVDDTSGRGGVLPTPRTPTRAEREEHDVGDPTPMLITKDRRIGMFFLLQPPRRRVVVSRSLPVCERDGLTTSGARRSRSERMGSPASATWSAVLVSSAQEVQPL